MEIGRNFFPPGALMRVRQKCTTDFYFNHLQQPTNQWHCYGKWLIGFVFVSNHRVINVWKWVFNDEYSLVAMRFMVVSSVCCDIIHTQVHIWPNEID